jgi:hypothetical protein
MPHQRTYPPNQLIDLLQRSRRAASTVPGGATAGVDWATATLPWRTRTKLKSLTRIIFRILPASIPIVAMIGCPPYG